MHSGRESGLGWRTPTCGCLRTTDEAMQYLSEMAEVDPLEDLIVAPAGPVDPFGRFGLWGPITPGTAAGGALALVVSTLTCTLPTGSIFPSAKMGRRKCRLPSAKVRKIQSASPVDRLRSMLARGSPKLSTSVAA